MKSLTIAHIDTETSWRGGQKQVVELIKGLEKLGQKNYLFCKSSSEISRRAEKNGIDVIHLSFRGEWDIFSALELRSFIKKKNVDIVHAHTSHAHTIGLLALWGIHTCKLVVSRRVDFHIQNYFSRKLKYGKRVSKIITVSDAIKRILIEDGVDPELLVTIRSGFVTGEFEKTDKSIDLKEKLGLRPDTVVVSTIAALAPHKAHQILLKAASHVLKKHPDVKFILAGEGEMKTKIEEDIHNLCIDKSIILLGFVEDVGAVYRVSDIFALSSEEEGLCTSILDAMYFGLPIVATSAGGIPELVRDGINGFIVPVNNYMLFAERLNVLIEDGDRRKTMGLRSSDILEQNTVQQTIEKSLAIYMSL